MYYSANLLNKSGRYFSLIGLLLAGLLCVLYSITSLVFSVPVSVTLLIITSILMTGAFHEDGLTDMADGIGGGMTIEKRLTIMKDSRIGTYGSVTLIMALLLKCFVLIEIAELTAITHSSQLPLFIPALLLGYALSRALAGSLIYDLPYVADIDTSKSKPLANKQSHFELAVLCLIGVSPLLYFSFTASLLIIAVLLVFRTLFKRWLMSRLGGYTGDCLGASQQISELLIYLSILAIYSSSSSPLNNLGASI